MPSERMKNNGKLQPAQIKYSIAQPNCGKILTGKDKQEDGGVTPTI
ncbi:hypothetical protein Z949_1568 [Sulfitobacter guttiformis KCTC 32187]|uniref:Uncharacterized protein n=1 Tax=Sulfitobacter guttiformis TaxID=74349 RepID=A0A420DI05_9RHOB|nr:hypothetical protein Z949_1568 [Sulfitobacter guttiformis KCTC 32187]RKE93848.1 hypothetical protein C8N30_2949 [Sulfitobacter guttiformis]